MVATPSSKLTRRPTILLPLRLVHVRSPPASGSSSRSNDCRYIWSFLLNRANSSWRCLPSRLRLMIASPSPYPINVPTILAPLELTQTRSSRVNSAGSASRCAWSAAGGFLARGFCESWAGGGAGAAGLARRSGTAPRRRLTPDPSRDGRSTCCLAGAVDRLFAEVDCDGVGASPISVHSDVSNFQPSGPYSAFTMARTRRPCRVAVAVTVALLPADSTAPIWTFSTPSSFSSWFMISSFPGAAPCSKPSSPARLPACIAAFRASRSSWALVHITESIKAPNSVYINPHNLRIKFSGVYRLSSSIVPTLGKCC